MNDWLQLGGLLDRLGLQAPTPAGLLDAPVGTSTTQRVSNASPERLLDWDKPLAQQPIEVRNIADTLSRLQEGSPFAKPLSTGADVYHAMRSAKPARELGYQNWSSAGPAQYLKETGLDGIQYLDQGSRAAGDGTRNYVMFRDDIIDILKRYGLLGMIGGGAAATAGAPEQ